jgi:hypothetical protein
MSNMSIVSPAEIRIQLADLMVEAILEFIETTTESTTESSELRRSTEDTVDALLDSMNLNISSEPNIYGAYMATIRLTNVREFLLEREI